MAWTTAIAAERKGSALITMTAPNAITRFQDTYVEKVIDTLNDLPNVLWIVSEEAPNKSIWWNDHQISHIRAYESGKPHQHPIGYAAPISVRGYDRLQLGCRLGCTVRYGFARLVLRQRATRLQSQRQ